MREISPSLYSTADQYFANLPGWKRELVESVRDQKRLGTRPLPSSTLIDQSTLLTAHCRCRLLDQVANLVDENIFGRSDMCEQFALLLNEAFRSLGIPSKVVAGRATYYSLRCEEIFHWDHVWVRIGNEVIDGNVDSMIGNPRVPDSVNVCPFWGPITSVPADRRLRAHLGKEVLPDVDVTETWWPELKQWIERELSA